MTLPLANLGVLRDEMAARGWVLFPFEFSYSGEKYFVFVRRYVEPEPVPDYAVVELRFEDQADRARVLEAPANRRRLMVGAKELRTFFAIQYADNLGDILDQFAARLGQQVPAHLPPSVDASLREVVLRRLSVSDAEDPTKIYCTSVRRNQVRADGSPGQRSAFNAQKTQLLRPELFETFKDDPGISFCYSAAPADERTDEAIIRALAARRSRA